MAVSAYMGHENLMLLDRGFNDAAPGESGAVERTEDGKHPEEETLTSKTSAGETCEQELCTAQEGPAKIASPPWNMMASMRTNTMTYGSDEEYEDADSEEYEAPFADKEVHRSGNA